MPTTTTNMTTQSEICIAWIAAHKFKMPVARKRKWVAALRSGDYVQGHRTLMQTLYNERDEQGDYLHSFCCLGVLCDVIDPDGWTNWDYKAGTHPMGNARWSFKGGRVDAGFPPSDILPTPVAYFLASCNDEYGWTYEQIADWVDEHL